MGNKNSIPCQNCKNNIAKYKEEIKYEIFPCICDPNTNKQSRLCTENRQCTYFGNPEIDRGSGCIYCYCNYRNRQKIAIRHIINKYKKYKKFLYSQEINDELGEITFTYYGCHNCAHAIVGYRTFFHKL